MVDTGSEKQFLHGQSTRSKHISLESTNEKANALHWNQRKCWWPAYFGTLQSVPEFTRTCVFTKYLSCCVSHIPMTFCLYRLQYVKSISELSTKNTTALNPSFWFKKNAIQSRITSPMILQVPPPSPRRPCPSPLLRASDCTVSNGEDVFWQTKNGQLSCDFRGNWTSLEHTLWKHGLDSWTNNILTWTRDKNSTDKDRIW